MAKTFWCVVSVHSVDFIKTSEYKCAVMSRSTDTAIIAQIPE